MRNTKGNLFTIILFLLSASLYGQVANNRIEDRIPLLLDSGAFSSFTTNSDVQWDCINRALTSRCLVYHNDQWFTMTPPTIGPYYINIHHQSCKKAYGVQLVILEGDPCKTDSYQLKRCVPFSDQSDFYVRLDSLRPHMEYLVNVDGYLGDLCAFQIEFSSTLRGVPINAPNSNSITPLLTLRDSLLTIKWTVPDSLAFVIKGLQLFRKNLKDKSHKQIAMPLIHNAYGVMQKEYEITDTLRQKGQYYYSIYGSTDGDMLLLSRQSVSFPVESKREIAKRLRTMRRQFEYYAPKAEFVTVHVFDDSSDRLLMTTNRRAEKGKNMLLLDFSDMVDEGIYFFKIVVSGKDISVEFKTKVEPVEK